MAITNIYIPLQKRSICWQNRDGEALRYGGKAKNWFLHKIAELGVLRGFRGDWEKEVCFLVSLSVVHFYVISNF